MMSSSCLSGGGSTPSGFQLHLVNSSTRSPSPSSSPASSSLTCTLSDSTHSPHLSVSTRKPRTLRKRPNQTYYEAAALLSTAFPNVFSPAPLPHRPPLHPSSPHDPSQFFLPFRILEDDSPSLIHHPSEDQKLLPILKETGPSPSCQTPDDCEIQSDAAAPLHHQYEEDFDAESMLDQELEEGIIDSIMGEKSSGGEAEKLEKGESGALKLGCSWGRSPMALLGLGGRLGLCYRGVRKARGGCGWRDVGQVNWCNFRTVDVNEISPKLNPNPALSSKNNPAAAEKKRKKVEKALPAADVWRNRIELASPATLGLGVKKMLKLDYENVLEAWIGRGSPFPDGSPASDIAGKVDRIMELIVEGVRHREKRNRPFTTTNKKKTRHIPMQLQLQ
ncbi:hypothetical protein MLD38_007250 [Melastoma candidum]|uniref:Uncharacterized protein n=1 Tax=Melastoma candidum TaxID=119954 RepID=A0ACB9RZ17_9MYRT|nr:hypothetical protein MLD38_007250 [Melastoma candidum]